MARTQNFKVGLLVIAATAILVIGIALVAGIRFAQPMDHYSIRFSESVSGLEPGSPVKYRGVRVGSVQELEIPPDDITQVEIWIGVKKGTPIKTDTKARLATVGITGLLYVELYGGTESSAPLPNGGRIESEPSLFASLSGRAESSLAKFDELLDNVLAITGKEEMERLKARLLELQSAALELMQSSTGAVNHVDAMVVRNEGHIDSSLAYLESGLRQLDNAFVELEKGHGIENFNATMGAGREMMTDLNALVTSNRRTVAEALANLREASANLDEFSRAIRQKPSLLLRGGTPERRRLPEAE